MRGEWWERGQGPEWHMAMAQRSGRREGRPMGAALGVYVTCLAGIVWALVWLAVCDWWLWAAGQPTVTDLLRERPELIVWAVSVALGGVCLLAVHLAWGR